MPIDLDRTLLFAAGSAMVVLAVVIFAVRPGRGIHRALAALVAARGVSTLLPQVSNDAAWTWTALHLQPYFSLAVVPLALYCMHAFTHVGDGGRRGAGWLALGAIVAFDLAYFFDHSLFHTLAAGETGIGALRAADGIQYVGFGPLWVVVALVGPVLAYFGLRLAVQYRRDPFGPDASLLFYVASGLLLGALFEGASRLAALTALLDSPGSFPWLPWGWAGAVLPLAALVPAGMAVAVLAANRASLPRTHRRAGGIVLGLAGFAFFSGFFRLLLPADSDVAGSALVLALMGLWRLAMPILVCYAIIRHPLREPTAADASPPNLRDAPNAPAQPAR